MSNASTGVPSAASALIWESPSQATSHPSAAGARQHPCAGSKEEVLTCPVAALRNTFDVEVLPSQIQSCPVDAALPHMSVPIRPVGVSHITVPSALRPEHPPVLLSQATSTRPAVTRSSLSACPSASSRIHVKDTIWPVSALTA